MEISELAKIAMTAAAISLAASMLIVYSQKWHSCLSLDHELCGIQKCHETPVPRVGGLAVFIGVLGALVMSYYFHRGLIATSHVQSVMTLLIASLPAFAAGIVEDVTKKVSVKARLLATVCSALAASALLGATINRIDIWGIDALLVFTPIALFVNAIVVAGGANAINIIDGFNGLSGSVIIVISAALGFLALQVGDYFVAILATLGIGAALGFLVMNYPTGKLFLGDGGAYFLGFWVSEIAVLLLVRNQSINAWQVLSICAYPVIEVLYSIYRRKVVYHVNAGSPDAMHMHTLVYRNVAARLVSSTAAHAWVRNAAVACVIVPWIGVVSAFTVIVGGTVILGVALVTAQVVLYVAIYGRLAQQDRHHIQNAGAVNDADAHTESL